MTTRLLTISLLTMLLAAVGISVKAEIVEYETNGYVIEVNTEDYMHATILRPVNAENLYGSVSIPYSFYYYEVEGDESTGHYLIADRIGDRAFDGCTRVTEFKIQHYCDSLGHEVFINCPNLTSIVLNDYGSPLKLTDDDGKGHGYSFAGINLQKLYLGRPVTSKNKHGFSNCTTLATLTIGEYVSELEAGLFAGCTGLTKIYCQPRTPAVCKDNKVFDFDKTNVELIVPETFSHRYKNADVWKDFTYIREIPDEQMYDYELATNISFVDFSAVNEDGITLYYKINPRNSSADLSIVPRIFNGWVYSSNPYYRETIRVPESVTDPKTGYTYTVRGIRGSFNDDTELTNIILPETIDSLYEQSFMNTTKLKHIDFPDNIRYMGQNCFAEGSLEGEVVMPRELRFIDMAAFRNENKVTKITFPDDGKLIELGPQSLFMMGEIEEIHLPPSVKRLGMGCMSGNPMLKKVNLPDGIEEMDVMIFARDPIESLVLPGGIKEFDPMMFGGIGLVGQGMGDPSASNKSTLKSLSVSPNNTNYDSRDNCNAIIETKSNTMLFSIPTTTIPESIDSIGSFALSGGVMEEITLPAGLKRVKSDACVDMMAYRLTQIGTIRSLIKSPAGVLEENAFGQTDNEDFKFNYENTKLIVPAGTKSLYLADSEWKKFKNIVEEEPGETVPVGNALVAGYSSDKALDFSNSDVTAWIATGVRGGNIQLSRVDIVPANTGIYVKATEAGDFDVPTTTEKSYYVNMFQPVVTATTVQPTVKIDGVTYQTLSFALSKETGKPGFFPNTEAKDYGNNKMYLQLPEWVLTAPTSGTTTSERVPVTIGTLGVAGFSSDKNLDFTSSDVEAWVATGFKGGNVQLTRVYAVPAGTGIYVKSKKTLMASTTFQIPVTTEVPYYVNLFVGLPNGGTVSPTEVVGGVTMQTLTFATSKTTGKPGFFPNTEDKTYGAGKMYLRLPADLVNGSDAARSLGLVFMDDDNVGLMEAETTGISDASHLNDNGEMINSGVVYDLQGRKIETSNFKLQTSKLPKGVYIVGGRRVVIK
jgi:hypothetical protein